MAKDENGGRAESCRRLAQARFEQGLHVGRLPIGYLPDPNGGPGIPDPKVAPIIAEALVLRANGASIMEVQAFLAQSGVRTRSGRLICRSSVHAMINNQFYAGCTSYKRTLRKGSHQSLTTVIKKGRPAGENLRISQVFQRGQLLQQ